MLKITKTIKIFSNKNITKFYKNSYCHSMNKLILSNKNIKSKMKKKIKKSQLKIILLKIQENQINSN